MTVAKASEALTLKSHLRHSVNYLKTLGVPDNNSIQVRDSNRLNHLSAMTEC